MPEIIQLAKIILISVGGAGFIIIGLATWLGKIWSDRIYLRTSAKYEKEIEDIKNRYSLDLERLRSEIAERRDLLSSLHGMLSSSYMASHGRILEAIEILWGNMGKISDFTGIYHIIYNLFSPHIFETISVSQIKGLIPTMTDENFSQKALSLEIGIGNQRLFVGEKLWVLYHIYSAFALRIAWKLSKETDQGKVYNWDKDIDGTLDKHLFGVLQGAFTDDELNNIIGDNPLSGIPQRIMNALEIKILNEMNELIFGRRLVNTSLEEQQRVMNLIDSTSYRTEKPSD